MKIKRYIISAAVALAAITSLSLALPAFAQVNVNVNASLQGQVNDNGRGLGMMNRGAGRGGPMMGRLGVVGTVSSVSGNMLIVSGRTGFGTTTPAVTFTVDATNSTVRKNNATSTVSAIVAGDTVFVQGTVSGTNVTATSIFDGAIMRRPLGAPGTGKPGDSGEGKQNWNASFTSPIQGNGQPVVAGKVSSVSGNTLTITNASNVIYSVDATNAKIVEGQNTIAVSSIKVGDSVVVQGAVNGTSITASSVIDQTGNPGMTPPGNNQGKHTGFFGGIGSFFMHLFGF